MGKLATKEAISGNDVFTLDFMFCYHTEALVFISSTSVKKKFLGHACPTHDLRAAGGTHYTASSLLAE